MVDQQLDSTSLEFNSYGRVLRRRWRVVVLFLLLGILAALAYVLASPQQFTATALVRINVIQSQTFSSQKSASGLIDAPTEQQLAQSTSVLTDAAKAMREVGFRSTPADVRQSSALTVVPDATVARVTYTAPTSGEARAGADSVANAYISYRTQSAQAIVDRIVRKLSKSRDSLRTLLVTVNRVLNTSRTGSVQAAQALTDRQVINLQLNTLVSQLNTTGGIDTSGGNLLTSAADNAVSVKPQKSLILEVGAMLGLILGLVAAFAVNAADRRVRDDGSVRKAGGGPVLATLASGVGTVPAPEAEVDEFRSLREQVLAAVPWEDPTFTVVDLGDGSAPGDVAANLTAALAEAGRDVDLVLPEHSPEFIRRVGHALSATGSQVTHVGSTPATVLTVPGRPVPASGERSGAVNGLARGARVTVVALPPRASRSLVLAAQRGGSPLVLIATRRRTKSSTIKSTLEGLESMRGPVLGTVLTDKHRRLELPTEAGERPLAASRGHG